MSLKEMIQRIPEGVVTRFAPSPTGYLHLGHVLNMIYVWGIARTRGGRVIARMEDHDSGRWRPEYEQAILADMEWLGFVPDEGLRAADALQRPSAYRQSDCGAVYAAALEQLRAKGLVFGCGCTRRELHALQRAELDELLYPGLCRTAGHPFEACTVRFRTEPLSVHFEDVRLGRRTQIPAEQCGDFSLRDRHGNWTYQFCVVCDDIRQGVNLVVRGDDLFGSTGRQILLVQALGGKPPLYFHHSLLTDENGCKLSKRQFSESIGQMREQGLSPGEILGRAAFAGGMIPESAALSVAEVLSLF